MPLRATARARRSPDSKREGRDLNNHLGVIATWEGRSCFGMGRNDFHDRAALAKNIGQNGLATMYTKAAAGENLASLGINSGTGAELTALIGSLARSLGRRPSCKAQRRCRRAPSSARSIRPVSSPRKRSRRFKRHP